MAPDSALVAGAAADRESEVGTIVRAFGDGGTRLNPVHVSDVVRLIDACVTQGRSGVVNVAGGQVTSVLEMVQRIGKLLEREPQLAFEPGIAEQFVADTTLMTQIIGKTPIGFDDGIGVSGWAEVSRDDGGVFD